MFAEFSEFFSVMRWQILSYAVLVATIGILR